MTDESQQSVCPVDHTRRAEWLENAAKTSRSPDVAPLAHSGAGVSSQSPQSVLSIPPRRKPSHPSQPGHPSPQVKSLGTEREVSTIPRASFDSGHAQPANNEQESGMSPSGNWIYPSEQMFFNAMKRKNYDPMSKDMKSIVPIHNAVNERAWSEIKRWESGSGSEKCGGPRLESFSGTATAMTPRARINTFLGYNPPFDRHDWVVDRCGSKIDYVIDFYAGKDEGKAGKSLNFYLDVRPKLNSIEGWRMRFAKAFGFG